MPNQDNDLLLQSSLLNTLEAAKALGNVKSISIPAISSGIFGFPKDRCAQILFQNCIAWAILDPGCVKRIRFCNFDRLTTAIFKNELMKRKAKVYQQKSKEDKILAKPENDEDQNSDENSQSQDKDKE